MNKMAVYGKWWIEGELSAEPPDVLSTDVIPIRPPLVINLRYLVRELMVR